MSRIGRSAGWRVVVGITTLFIGTFAGAAQINAQRSDIGGFLEKWDTDQDGTLSLDEIKKAAIVQFEALDRKHRGKLTRSQLAGIVSFQELRQADKDKDGALNKDEFLSVVEKRFQAADKDHDGTLDRKELETSPGKALLGLFAIRNGPIM